MAKNRSTTFLTIFVIFSARFLYFNRLKYLLLADYYILNIASCQYFPGKYYTFMKTDIEPLRIILSYNIKKYRSNFKYTQEKLAEKAGISAQTLNDIEGCRRWVSPKTMTKLAKALNIAEYQLILPGYSETDENSQKSSLKSLIALKEAVKDSVDIQFEKAIETGNFT